MEVPSKVYYQHYEVLQKIQKLRTPGYSRWILANPEELQKIEKNAVSICGGQAFVQSLSLHKIHHYKIIDIFGNHTSE